MKDDHLQDTDVRRREHQVRPAAVNEEHKISEEDLYLLNEKLTELKAVQQQLEDREAQLRLITNSLPVLISYVDNTEKYRFANAEYERWFGIPASSVLGKSVREVVGESTYERIRDNIRRVLAGEQHSWEQKLPYQHGGNRYVHAEYVPHCHSDGKILGYYALIQDITERRAAEDALARSEEEFRTIFELSASGNAQVDPTTRRFIRVNRRLCDITGYSAEELLQKTYSDITHPDDIAADRAVVERVLRGEEERWTSEKRYLRKNGEYVWVLVSGALIRDRQGRPLHSVATILDIDDRKRTEQTLRETAERFRTLADNIAQLAWMADSSGWIFWYNKRWFEYTGTSLAEMQGWGWQKVHHPDHVGRVVEKVRRCFETGQVWEDTFPLRSKEGTYRWFLSRAIPIRDATGKVIRWFGTNTDITERMQMEEALKQADRRKDEFLATLAHELRNPLAPIRTGLELLRRAGDDRAMMEEVRAMMERQTEQLTRLIDDLLDVSRITRGKVELRKSYVELAAVVQSAVETVRPLIDETRHELHITLPEEPIFLYADATRLAQILANLLNNAAKYMEKGGQIWLVAERQGNDVIVMVKDSGAGIPPPMLEHIFDLFTQVKGSLERVNSGLGIGLTLVKSLVELHGGTVSARSEGCGRGSEFIVRLPVSAELRDAKPDARKVAGYAMKAATRRVLVVDDNWDSVTSLSLLLTASGHNVHTAYDGLEALGAAEAFRPDVVLLDLGMPKLDGYETAHRLREQAWGKEIILIALTGWGQDEDRRRTQEAGFDHHLVKPVKPDELQALLGELPSSTESFKGPGC